MPDPTTPQPRWLHGDEATLFRSYDAALRIAVRAAVAGPDVHVDDACSHAWLQLMRHQPARDQIFAWLKVVAIRHAWRLNRTEDRDLHLDARPAWIDWMFPVDDDARLRAREALRAVADLPDRQRDYITRQAAGHTYNEIATTTGATRTNVNKHLVKARRHLRDAAQ